MNCVGSSVDPNIKSYIDWAHGRKKPIISAAQPFAVNNPSSFVDYLAHVKSVVETFNRAGWTYINSNWPAHGWGTQYWGDSRIEANGNAKSWFASNIAKNGRYVRG